ncbi:MAG: 30S ribosomal protein S5 [Dehalococcoidia bacterium]|nr:30S ribosomal protein S5 [Dehalococcoidia bacterium]MDH4291295.1 30S ribosomal protein S5 [Dehalococcoidia bacterium]
MKAVTKLREKKGRIDSGELTLEEKLLGIDRVTKVVKGGRHLRFRALVVVGDGLGHVGFGLAKAAAIPEAVRKAGAMAKKRLIEVPIKDGTIPHEILAKFGASKILLKPAAPGTGLIVGSTARAVLELAGVRDVLGKSLGGRSKINVAKATMVALSNLRKSEEAANQPALTDVTAGEAQKEKVDETE